LHPKPTVNWLIHYFSKLSSEYKEVIAGKRKDNSQDKLKIVFHRERFTDFLTGNEDKIVPITFEVWPSLSCDARCALCPYILNDARKEADQSTEHHLANIEKYKMIFEDFANSGINSLIFTGGGEPTLHPHVTQMTSYANKLNLKWGMFTHGLNLSEKMIHEFMQSHPRFIRISVNAGSEKGHHNEYRFGMNSYHKVKENIIKASLISAEYERIIGIGYALNGKTDDSELKGISKFITTIMEETKGALNSASFRPKVIYYNKKQISPAIQPSNKNLSRLAEKIENFIIDPLRRRFGSCLKLDHKRAMFMRAAQHKLPLPAVSNMWTGQIDQLGNGYILSELNGSPWKNACYGQFDGRNFLDLWLGERRKNLSEAYSVGDHFPPVHHKLSHIDEILHEIRMNIGILKIQDVNDFYESIGHIDLQSPKNWDFL